MECWPVKRFFPPTCRNDFPEEIGSGKCIYGGCLYMFHKWTTTPSHTLLIPGAWSLLLGWILSSTFSWARLLISPIFFVISLKMIMNSASESSFSLTWSARFYSFFSAPLSLVITFFYFRPEVTMEYVSLKSALGWYLVCIRLDPSGVIPYSVTMGPNTINHCMCC